MSTSNEKEERQTLQEIHLKKKHLKLENRYKIWEILDQKVKNAFIWC